MAFVAALQNISVTAPTGLWESILFAFNNGILNYAWAVIIFTIVLKVIISPLDFFNRRVSVNNSKLQKVIQPEIKKLEHLYGNNIKVLNQKKAEVYNKHNYNVKGACLTTIVYFVVTILIFTTLLGSLNSIAKFKSQSQFEELACEYYQAENFDEIDMTAEISNPEEANERVSKLYKQIKDSWLWIDNVWQNEAPWKNSIMSFDEYRSFNGLQFKADIDPETKEVIKSAETKESEFKAMYEKIMNPLRQTDGKTNGYLIIALCVIVFSVLSQLAMQGKFSKKKNENDTPMPGGLLLVVLMPLILVYFTVQYNSVFALYMAVSTAFGFATMPIINLISRKIDEKKRLKKEEINKADPRTNYKR